MRRLAHPGEAPQHLADDMDLVERAGIGRVVGVGREDAELRRAGLAGELDALDHEAVAVPQHEELAGRGDAARGVDEEAVAVAELGLHRGAAHAQDADRVGLGVALVADEPFGELPAPLLQHELLVPGAGSGGGLDLVAEVKADNLAGAAAARWLALSPEERANAGLMAPSHGLREEINAIVRERLVRDGTVHGPALESERLVSRGYTNAEKTLAANYRAGDVVAFHRPYRRLGVDKGDELRVAGVDHATRTVNLRGEDGRAVAWEPNRLAARAGGVEVYRTEDIELRAGDRIRWTRNDAGLGLVNSQTAEVAAVRDGRVSFRLGDGRVLDLAPGDPQLRHVDRAWASTVHAFQGRTVDTVIAAMEANHPHLTTQKTLYVEISRARDRAELVTDDKAALRETLEAVTGERIAALEAVEPERAKNRAAGLDADRSAGREGGAFESRQPERTPGPDMEEARTPKSVDRDLGL